MSVRCRQTHCGAQGPAEHQGISRKKRESEQRDGAEEACKNMKKDERVRFKMLEGSEHIVGGHDNGKELCWTGSIVKFHRYLNTQGKMPQQSIIIIFYLILSSI